MSKKHTLTRCFDDHTKVWSWCSRCSKSIQNMFEDYTFKSDSMQSNSVIFACGWVPSSFLLRKKRGGTL